MSYLSLINLCVQSLSRSLSVFIDVWSPQRNVRNKCEHTMRVGMVLVVRPYVHYIYTYSDKHTSAREEIIISPPNYLKEARFARQLYNIF